jgi:hypothetical protein
MADDTYTVARSLTIAAPPSRAYEQIVDFHKWVLWSPWEGLDPQMQRSYSGPESGTGAMYSWSGNRRAGQGRMKITEATEPSRVQIDLVFEKPWKAQSETVFSITPDGSGSRITWTMSGKKTLMTRVIGIFKSMDAMVGPDFEKGLAKLKATSELPTGR